MTMTDQEQNREQTAEELNEQMRIRHDKMRQISSLGIEPYGRNYQATHHAAAVLDNFEKLQGQTVKIAGRIMAIRGHGKATFAHLMDITGRLQVYFRQDVLGEEAYC